MTVLDLPLEHTELPGLATTKEPSSRLSDTNTFFSYTVIIVSRQGHAFVDVDARKRMVPKMTSSYCLVRFIEMQSSPSTCKNCIVLQHALPKPTTPVHPFV